MVKVQPQPAGLVLDLLADSGTFGEATAKHGRYYLLIDNIPEAIQTMIRRLASTNPTLIGCDTLLESS